VNGAQSTELHCPLPAGLLPRAATVTLSSFCGLPNEANAGLRRVRATHNAESEEALCCQGCIRVSRLGASNLSQALGWGRVAAQRETRLQPRR